MTTVTKILSWKKIALYIALIFTAIGISVVLNTTSAYADVPGGGGIDIGGGGQQPPATGPGTDIPDTAQPADEAYGYQVPTLNETITVGCDNWNGAGSWQMAAHCNISSGSVQSHASSPNASWGYLRWSNGGVREFQTSFAGSFGCGPGGNKSAYAQNFYKGVNEAYYTVNTYRWNRNFGWVAVHASTTLTGQNVSYVAQNCLYPETRWSEVTCFWNYDGDSKYSIDRLRNEAAWEHFGDRPALPSDPRPPSGGAGTTPPNCDRTGTAYVYYRTYVDELGYYRLNIEYDYRTYYRESWVIWGWQEVYFNWTQGATLHGHETNFWTYSCNPGLPNALQGPFPNQGSIPNVDQFTNPATCPQVTWQCALDTPTTIGLERDAVLNGTISPSTRASVMRNGQQINVDFARVRVVDTSTPTDIDVTNGGSAPSVRNVSNIEYQTVVKPGSTPFFGSDPNAGMQYFKYYSARGSNSKERFNSWLGNNNANLDKAISFNWASESLSQPFQLQRNYRVTAEFYIPGGSTVGTGGVGGNPGYQWKVGTYDCRDYFGRGSSRVDLGPLTSTSNPVDVVRATNK